MKEETILFTTSNNNNFRLTQIRLTVNPSYIEFVLEEKKLINLLFFKFKVYKEIGRCTQNEFINNEINKRLLKDNKSKYFYYWTIIDYIKIKNNRF